MIITTCTKGGRGHREAEVIRDGVGSLGNRKQKEPLIGGTVTCLKGNMSLTDGGEMIEVYGEEAET